MVGGCVGVCQAREIMENLPVVDGLRPCRSRPRLGPMPTKFRKIARHWDTLRPHILKAETRSVEDSRSTKGTRHVPSHSTVKHVGRWRRDGNVARGRPRQLETASCGQGPPNPLFFHSHTWPNQPPASSPGIKRDVWKSCCSGSAGSSS